jgi:hypothetical protein
MAVYFMYGTKHSRLRVAEPAESVAFEAES